MTNIEYAVLLDHASPNSQYEYVGTPHSSLPAATDELVRAKAAGYGGTVCQREDGGPWTTLSTGKTPIEYLQGVRGLA